MMVLVDTPIWSLALRRSGDRLNPREQKLRGALEQLIGDGMVALPGAIRQELLSGIREPGQYERLRRSLRAFPDISLSVEDYEEAARLSNRCRAEGIAGSAVDFLLCGVALRRPWTIFTSDGDFARYATCAPIRLLTLP